MVLTSLDAVQTLQKWKSWAKCQAAEGLALPQSTGQPLLCKWSPEFQLHGLPSSPSWRTPILPISPAICSGFCSYLMPAQRRSMRTPWYFKACYIHCQVARCAVLPEGSLWVTLPAPNMRRALLVRNAAQQLFSHGSYHFNRRELFIPLLMDGCKQKCYPKVHWTACGVQKCMWFSKSYDLFCPSTSAELYLSQVTELCNWGGNGVPSSVPCASASLQMETFSERLFIPSFWAAWSLGAAVGGCDPVLRSFVVNRTWCRGWLSGTRPQSCISALWGGIKGRNKGEE